MSVYRFIVRPSLPDDPRSTGLLEDAHVLGLSAITKLQCNDLYFIEGRLSHKDLQRLANELLSDPITQTIEWGRVFSDKNSRGLNAQPPFIIEVALRPGVTDSVAEQIVRAADVLGITGVERASSGLHFLIEGKHLSKEDLHRISRRLLANPTIHRYSLGEIEPVFPQPVQASSRVEILPLRHLPAHELQSLSRQRRAALDLAEMQAIQTYYLSRGRDPSDVEFETIAQTWSEHCVHKTFKAMTKIEESSAANNLPDEDRGSSSVPDDEPQSPLAYRQPEIIDGLLRTYIRAASEQIAAPWVRSAFVDNAGVIDFDEQYEISFKVETHNHPSAIEPFGGANTGVGGVIRDVLGVSARPIAATDVLCFGPQRVGLNEIPEGVLHPRRIRSGVVAGVQDYGNKIGIPTVNGAIVYDPGFTANPLVFCGCVGIAPKGSHPRTALPGDRVILIGGRTGRDGLRGATFSSMAMDGQTGEVAGASVQIGDPITEKGLIEVVTRARDLGLYHAVTDCGAGGLSSAVGEMASRSGADVDLAHVRLKYPGLAPWEIWLSEAQERMVLAVPAESLDRLSALCQTFEVELMDIGMFTDTNCLVVHSGNQVVLDLDNEFLHHGLPQRFLTARIPTPAPIPPAPAYSDSNTRLLQLLASPNIASKADIIRIYDHEVQGGTVVKPLTGIRDDGPSDACVIKPFGSRGPQGIVLSNGINPEYGKYDSYRMAVSVVDEAIRNAVAVGADPERIALLDNFCWGDPTRPETLGALVEAARGCHDAALHYQTPFISGKDSLNNEYLGEDGKRHSIPPTLLISAIGVIEDVRRSVTMDLKAPGNRVYLLGNSWPVQVSAQYAGTTEVPSLPDYAPALYRALHQAMVSGLVRACHDLSEGGLAVAAAEMCIGGRLGLSILFNLQGTRYAMFSETNGCLLVEVAPPDCAAFEAYFNDLPIHSIGQVSTDSYLTITSEAQTVLSLPLSDLVSAWQSIL